MASIKQFAKKWQFYKTRASRISPYFEAVESVAKITQSFVAGLIPKDPGAPLLADDGGEYQTIVGAAVGEWFRGEILPDDRIKQWEKLTGVSVEDWEQPDLDAFERAVRRLAGEVLGWNDLVRGAQPGLQIFVEDPHRLAPLGHDAGPAEPLPLRYLWPECHVRVQVPARLPIDGDDRRIWLLSDYGLAKTAYLLDPVAPKDGPASSSRLHASHWEPDRQGGHVMLPRAAPRYVWVPPSTQVGTKFDVLALMLNFHEQPDEVRLQFDSLERRIAVGPRTHGYQETLRRTLDAAATLIGEHGIPRTLYRQKCEVVSRHTAAENGNV